jgi:hypothetical protein
MMPEGDGALAHPQQRRGRQRRDFLLQIDRINVRPDRRVALRLIRAIGLRILMQVDHRRRAQKSARALRFDDAIGKKPLGLPAPRA